MWSFSLFISSAWMLLVADLCTLNAVLNRNLKVICVTRGFNESLGQAVKRSNPKDQKIGNPNQKLDLQTHFMSRN
jgi:hypothetical protein